MQSSISLGRRLLAALPFIAGTAMLALAVSAKGNIWWAVPTGSILLSLGVTIIFTSRAAGSQASFFAWFGFCIILTASMVAMLMPEIGFLAFLVGAFGAVSLAMGAISAT